MYDEPGLTDGKMKSIEHELEKLKEADKSADESTKE